MLLSARNIEGVLAGKSLTESLAATPASARGAVQSISFHVLRRLGHARQIRITLVPRQPSNTWLDALLMVSLALLDTAMRVQEDATAFEERPDVPVYAVHTVVDQAVRAADSQAALRLSKGLVNGVLRRFTRERKMILSQVESRPEARWNHPGWWVKELRRAYPRDWEALLQAANRPGPLTLRVNQRRCSVERLQAVLTEAGIASSSPGAGAVTLDKAMPVQAIPGFDLGWWSVQDWSAQQAGLLLPVQDGMRVLDACAAPGGKTAHLLEQADVSLLALDSDGERLERVGHNLRRLGLESDKVQLKRGDAARPAQWWDGQPFDAILADVPCTASGIVRRHPDIRWLRRESDIADTARLQSSILDALWSTLRPGGHFLYSTCSIFPAEGEQQVEAFLARHPEAQLLDSPGQILPGVAGRSLADGDGFFYALFTRPV
ncbi:MULTISPECIES: 16S rRNA (cytosine(967)-C(5))-methyltransferase RsmB [Alcaligenes]|jgi:16S rRNA (cytosine967-C5)-methyltransferase|uniref:16S rRNA (cytosine(967)-C(5))-methyltransferase n=1 Tax=Alcaligenes faecalis TaxID=511 RepID=A0AB33D5R8_ALCFA|nr:16S rRNA (cytosine(967)-C(5))-methyltransferase RsmB [Alcaligenes faecalis]ASR91558.1 16S rRNA (cytosine(967)-C(5))-methyltransferase [Alcaligenes faecalis]